MKDSQMLKKKLVGFSCTVLSYYLEQFWFAVFFPFLSFFLSLFIFCFYSVKLGINAVIFIGQRVKINILSTYGPSIKIFGRYTANLHTVELQ